MTNFYCFGIFWDKKLKNTFFIANHSLRWIKNVNIGKRNGFLRGFVDDFSFKKKRLRIQILKTNNE